MNKNSKIYVAGHRGLAGSAITESLKNHGYLNLVTRSHAECELTDPTQVQNFFKSERPEVVILCAAKVGGIHANNTYPADFIYENLQIQNNVIHQSKLFDVKKLLFLGSSCIYPKYAPQPLKEEYLLSGTLEPTNEPYAIAKIAGIEMCRSYRRQYQCDFISAMPTNLYGFNDNFHLENSHVLPALIHKFHLAKLNHEPHVNIWGSGKPYREFLHSQDFGEACLFLLENYDGNEIVNVGTGKDISIKDLAELIRDTVNYEGELVYDESKPDGTPRKLLDTSRINELGWTPKLSLQEGLKITYQWFLDHYQQKEDIRQ
jgi:GDP-L-fucose synthase